MTTATHLAVPTRSEVSENNQAIFDQLQSGIGMVPNLYATLAYSETALADYLQLQNRKTTLSAQQREVINLVVSQVNECHYCLAAHTLLAQKVGFTAEQVIEIRHGAASFDSGLDRLAEFTKAVAERRGKVTDSERQDLLDAGYSEANLVDIIVAIGDKIITNYLHNVTQVPVDFPAAPHLDGE